MNQQSNILSVLEAACVDFLVERTPSGVRVETESRDGRDGISCEGSSVTDALAQVAQVLFAELAYEPEDAEALGVSWVHDDESDVDVPMPFVVEPLVAFCPVMSEQGFGCGHVPRPGWCAGCRLTVDEEHAIAIVLAHAGVAR